MRQPHGLLLCCCFFLNASMAIGDQQTQAPGADSEPATQSQPTTQPQPTPWLEEVRAQREAWEAQRQAAHQAANARLRLFDPWGAAQLQALDQEAEERRRAARTRSELFRRSTEAKRRAMEWQREERERMMWQYTPYGRDDPWFYGGY